MKIKGLTLCLLLGLTLLSCGGGSDVGSTPSASPPVSESAVGLWNGMITSDVTHQTQPVQGIVTANNEMRLIGSEGAQLEGSIVVNGNALAGTLTGYAPWGNTWPDKGVIAIVTLRGAVSTKASLSGTYSGGGDSGTFILSYDSASENHPDLSLLAITWKHNSPALGTIFVTIRDDGTMAGIASVGCTLAGNISVIDTTFNAYHVTLSLTSCGSLNGDYGGLATLMNSSLIIGASNPSASLTLTLRGCE